MEKIAVITVNFENYDVTKDFLKSFEKQTSKDFHIFLVDLSENKKTLELPDFAEVLYSKNGGYAHGVNVGLKTAINKAYVKFVVINNDTEVSPDFITSIEKSLQKEHSAIIGGKIYYYEGFEYHKDRYLKKDLGKVLWYAGGHIDWKNMIVTHRGVDEVDHGQYDREEITEFITGCLMCFKKDVVDRVGFWDESYFLYYEDTDWTERAKRKGISLVHDPSIMIWHKNAQSTGGAGSNLHEKYQRKNQLKFGLKYASFRTKLHLLKNYFFN